MSESVKETGFNYYVPMAVKVTAANDGSYSLSMTESDSGHEAEKGIQLANAAALAQFWYFRKLPAGALGETLLSLHTDYSPYADCENPAPNFDQSMGDDFPF